VENQQLGVRIEHSTIIPREAPQTAVPLFIGYTRNKHDGLVEITSFDNFSSIFFRDELQSESSNFYYSVKHFFDNGGQGGFVFSLGTIPKCISWSNIGSQLDALIPKIEAEERITLLAFPEISYFKKIDDWQRAWETLLTACQVRSGLFAILDTPENLSDVRELLNKEILGDNFGAAYWPHLETTYLGENEKNIKVPPSAAVIAAIQKIDQDKGLWCAPANVTLAQVIGPSSSHYDLIEQSGQRAVNLIRRFPGRGTKIWGCRTLSKGPQLVSRYVQTRRLLSYCEQQLSLLAQQFVFEPNNELTWHKLKGLVDNWLHKLWHQGALSGEDEGQAYQVKLGLGETMHQDDILAGRMIMTIKISPIAPAEFIELNLLFNMNSR